MAQKPPARLLVSDEVLAEVDTRRIEVVIETRREWTKKAVNDAIVRIGLQHLDEVAALLTRDEDAPNDE
ncbi:hypothetical protein [Actinomadura atramentaria]|uniref:hypothetical protein n=1 Tax=Actinomadura atramentaria TaxID=1990 RepID=UPI00036BA242|nr:hypothetical protein [Actinomadura atramentaria]